MWTATGEAQEKDYYKSWHVHKHNNQSVESNPGVHLEHVLPIIKSLFVAYRIEKALIWGKT